MRDGVQNELPGDVRIVSVAADAMVVVFPDADAMFKGDYQRHGDDLIVVGEDGFAYLLIGYFGLAALPTLVSPGGAMLTGGTVSRLAGPLAPGQIAQDGGVTGQEPIGFVQTVEGAVTVQRANGVTETLQVGDPVFQNDVVSTEIASGVGLALVDETIFSMTANARFVLNELIYDPTRTDNSLVVDIVQGTFAFVTGNVAGTGGMTVETPVATMGIRGTAPVGTVDANTGEARFSITNDPGTDIVGRYVIFRKGTDEVLAVVTSTESTFTITSVTGQAFETSKTPTDLNAEQVILGFFNQVYDNYVADPVIPPASPPVRDTDDGELQDGEPKGDEAPAETEATDPAQNQGEGGEQTPQGPVGGAPQPQGEDADAPTRGLNGLLSTFALANVQELIGDTSNSDPVVGGQEIVQPLLSNLPDNTNDVGAPPPIPPTADVLPIEPSRSNPITTTFTGSEDTQTFGSISSPDVSAYTLTAQPVAGTVSLAPDGNFVFDPGNDFHALGGGETLPVFFSYEGTDAVGAVVETGDIEVIVQGLNDAPTIVIPDLGGLATVEDQSVQLFGFGFQDAENDPITVSLTARSTVTLNGLVAEGVKTQDLVDLEAQFGQAVFSVGDGFDDEAITVVAPTMVMNFLFNGFIYTPTPDNEGPGGLDIAVSDGSQTSQTSVAVAISAVDDAPTVTNVTVVGADDTTPVTGSFSGSDPDSGDTITFALLSVPGSGTLVNNGDGTFTYDPGETFRSLKAGENFTTTATYQATDSTGLASNVGVIALQFTGIDEAPIAENDLVTGPEDTPVTARVLDNDSDPDNDPLTASLVTGPSNGGVVNNSDGSFTYTPNLNFNGQDSFVYQIADGNGGTSTATVTIDVTPVNDPPNATDDGVYITPPQTQLVVSTADGLLANDIVVDPGDTRTFAQTVIVTALGGLVEIAADGGFTYTPPPDKAGIDTFDYTVVDGEGLTATATVDLLIEPTETIGQVITGTPDDDILAGTLGKDAILALNGFDFILGSAGSDLIDGGGVLFVDDFGNILGDFGNYGFVGYQYETGGGPVDVLFTGLITARVIDTFGDIDQTVNIFEFGGTMGDDRFEFGDGVNLSFDLGLFVAPLGGFDLIIGSAIGWDTITYSFAHEFPFGGMNGIVADWTTGTVTDPWGDIDTFFEVESIIGTIFDDTFIGNIEFNRFRGLDGIDLYVGDPVGIEEVDFRRDAQNGGLGEIFVDLGAGTATDGFGNVETLIAIDRARGGVTTDDTLIGSMGENRLRGEGGDDLLRGLQGSDRLEGGGGDDRLEAGDEATDLRDQETDKLRGNEGDDTLIAGFGRGTNIIGGAGNDFIDGIGSFEDGYNAFIRYIEEGGGFGVDLEFTGSGIAKVNDTFNDGSLRPNDPLNTDNVDTVQFLSEISGTLLDDTAVWGDGIGGFGPFGDEGLSFRPYGGFDFIDVNPANFNVLKYNEDVQLGGLNGIIAFWDRGDNNLFADPWGATDPWGNPLDGVFGVVLDPFGDVDLFDGIDSIRGTEFDDIAYGDDGNNRFQALLGADMFDGRDGFDTIDFREFGGLVRNIGINANLQTGEIQDGFGNVATVVDVESVRGSRIDDEITGSTGQNRLRGEAGDDVLDGFGGIADFLQGDAGADLFVISPNYGQFDIGLAPLIEDFVLGEDRIGLADGLAFADLQFRQSGSNTDIFILDFGEEVATEIQLARLHNVDAVALQAAQNDGDPSYDPFAIFDRGEANVAPQPDVAVVNVVANERPDLDPNEGQPILVTGTFGFTDANLADLHSVTISALNGNFVGTSTAFIIQNFGDGFGTVNWSVSIDESAFEDLGVGDTETFSFDVAVDDGNDTANVTLNIPFSGANDAPALSNIPAGSTTDEDVPLTISGLTVSDADGDVPTVTLSVTMGTLAFTDGTDTSALSNITGSGTPTLSFAGSIENINAALATSIRYVPNANISGTDTLTYTVDDGNGGVDNNSFDITINAVDDPLVRLGGIPDPSFVANGSNTFDASAFFSDVDGPPITYTIATTADGTTPGWVSIDVNGVISAIPTGADAADATAVPNVAERTVGMRLTATNASGSTFDDFLLKITPDVIGTAANNTLNGNAASNYIAGLAGNDIIMGGAEDDLIEGDGGEDSIVAQIGDGDDHIDGGADTDIYNAAVATNPVFINLVAGTATGIDIGNDTILNVENASGGTGSDEFRGDANDNAFEGNGSGDNDVVRYDHVTGGGVRYVGATGGAMTATVTGLIELSQNQVGTDMLSNIESFVGTDQADDFDGGDFNELVSNTDGVDDNDGGGGTQDQLNFTNANALEAVEINLAAATDQIVNDGFGNTETAINFEDVVTADRDDTVHGSAGDNFISTNGGDDTVTTGGGGDVVALGAGDDRVSVDPAFFSVDGGFGQDTMILTSGSMDLTLIPNDRIKGIETLDFRTGNNLNSVTVDVDDIISMSDEISDLIEAAFPAASTPLIEGGLVIDGDGTGAVNLVNGAGGFWTQDFSETDPIYDHFTYQEGGELGSVTTAVVFIDENITVPGFETA